MIYLNSTVEQKFMSHYYLADDLYGVYGASGCGRGVMPLARELYSTGLKTDDHSRLVFIDDATENESPAKVNNHRVLSYAQFLEIPAKTRYIVVAIANSFVRAKLVQQCVRDGVQEWTVIAPNVVIMDDVVIGAGAIISPFVTITSNIRIGRSFHANLGSYVEHDCTIGDFVTFAPGVKCNGNVEIRDGAYLGAGCLIRQGKPGKSLVIGEGAVIGMGAVVTRDVAAGDTVVGNPARVLIKN